MKLRVPNPKKQRKGRLDAPPAKITPSKKVYRRKEKYPPNVEKSIVV